MKPKQFVLIWPYNETDCKIDRSVLTLSTYGDITFINNKTYYRLYFDNPEKLLKFIGTLSTNKFKITYE